ncbi:MAG: HlyD family efflux transporter periplasmic adaptor subunit [Candidatus Aminicenantes bacterium]|nr:HlyD family efflux transporter periplasmic adaptor subunit [Candidatus Aminicenantes bacterium]
MALEIEKTDTALSGMDRKIKKKKWTPGKIAVWTASGAFVLFMLYLFIFKLNRSALNVQTERLTISTVERGPFQEFIPVQGNVLPIYQHYLTAMEGGQVEEIFILAGAMVKKGEQIVRLANTNLLLDIMWREAELFQQSNNLRNTRLALEQYRLQLSQALEDVDSELQRQKRVYDRYARLIKEKLISQHEYELSRDLYEHLVRKKALTEQSMANELKFRQAQVDALEGSLQRMQTNLDIVKEKQENLVIRAPVSGLLSALSVEIGQSKAPGERLGQIDVLEGFKVRAPVDELYLPRIQVDKPGEFDHAGKTYRLKINWIYPEVTEGRFNVDMSFEGPEPEGITRGQTYHIRLFLSDVSEGLLLAKGGFFQSTGGNWAYVVDRSGSFAEKRRIRVGRQNTQVYEVLEGLEEGDRVITSSYESFGDIERLILK